MKQNRGPVISSFIHTETQDGKCLINAHFTHATFKVHRWLKSVQRNTLKKATTPRELADALASDGGMPNCSLQLVSFEDGTTLSKLDRYVSIVSSVASELLEYFSRANEIKYFPDDDAKKPWAKLDLSNPESWMKARFSIQVFAYSGIRKGATFNIDVGEKSVNVEGIPVTECVAESERAHDAGDNDDDDLATTLESLKTTIDWNLMTVSKLKDEL